MNSKESDSIAFGALAIASLTFSLMAHELQGKFGGNSEKYRSDNSFSEFSLHHAVNVNSEEALIHVSCVSLFLVLFMIEQKIFVALIPALLFGLGACLATQHLSSGLYEIVAMLIINSLSLRFLYGKWKQATYWIGSILLFFAFLYIFNQNNPIFTHPSWYILMEVKLWYQFIVKTL